MKKHYKIQVKGRVQGVTYRASTKNKAQQLNVTGFVRNEPDGTVYVEAEGEESTLEQLVNWCHDGPMHAKVKDIYVEKTDQLKNYDKFTIDY